MTNFFETEQKQGLCEDVRYFFKPSKNLKFLIDSIFKGLHESKLPM